MIFLSFRRKGTVETLVENNGLRLKNSTTAFEQNLVFVTGIGEMLSVPVIHRITGLPPFMGILFAF